MSVEPVPIDQMDDVDKIAAAKAVYQGTILDEAARALMLEAGLASGLGTGGGSGAASGVTYDHTASGLTAVNVQTAIDEVVATVNAPTALGSTQWGTLAGKTLYPLKAFAPYGIVQGANHNSVWQKAFDSGAQFWAPPLAFSTGGTPQPYYCEHLEVSPYSQCYAYPGLTLLEQIAGTNMNFMMLRPGTERDMGSLVLKGLSIHLNRDSQTVAPTRGLALYGFGVGTLYNDTTPWDLDDFYWRIEEILIANSGNSAFTFGGRFGSSIFRDLFAHETGSTQTYAGGDACGFDILGFDGKFLHCDSGNSAGPAFWIRGNTNILTNNKGWFAGFDQSAAAQKGRFPSFRDDGLNNHYQLGLQDCQGTAALIIGGGGQGTLTIDGVNDGSKGVDSVYLHIDGLSSPQMANDIRVNGSEQGSTRAAGMIRRTNSAAGNIVRFANRPSSKGVPDQLRQAIYGGPGSNVMEVNGMRVYG